MEITKKKKSRIFINFNENQKQILLGSLLGDGSISHKINSNFYKYSEKHSTKQNNYILWKNSILNFNLYNYKDNSYSIEKGNKALKKYYNLFYPNGKKIVTRGILNNLEPLGLAIWFMDDGSYIYSLKDIILSTHSFGLGGNQIIQQWFKDKFDINCKIDKINKGVSYIKGRKIESKDIHYVIRMNNEDTKRFIEIVKPHIIPEMKYKLGMDEKRREETRIRLKKYSKEYSLKNKGMIKEKNNNYYQKNKERIKINTKRYAEMDKDRTREYKRKWYHQHKLTI